MGRRKTGDWFKEPEEELNNSKVNCPKCSVGMTPEAVLCMACGFNQVTGEYVSLPGVPSRRVAGKRRKSRLLRSLPFMMVAALLAAGLYIYLNYEAFMLKHRQHIPKSLAYELPANFDRPYAPLWLKDYKYKAIHDAFEDLVKDELNVKHPLFAHNEEVSLSLLSGKTRTGTFKTANDTAVLLEIDAEIFEIPFPTLTTKTRVRCDRAERDVFINKIAHDRALIFLMGKHQEQEEAPAIHRANNTALLGKQEGGSLNKGCSE